MLIKEIKRVLSGYDNDGNKLAGSYINNFIKTELMNGLTLNEKDTYGSPISAQIGLLNPEVLDLALEKGLKIIPNSIVSFVSEGNIESLKFLLKKGISLNLIPEIKEDFDSYEDKVEMTPYHGLVDKDYDTGKTKFDKKVASFLLKNDVDINGRNTLGRTALHSAAIEDNVPLVKFLLENGCDKTIKDIKGKKAFHLADKNAKCKSLLK